VNSAVVGVDENDDNIEVLVLGLEKCVQVFCLVIGSEYKHNPLHGAKDLDAVEVFNAVLFNVCDLVDSSLKRLQSRLLHLT